LATTRAAACGSSAQQSDMFGISTVLGGDPLPELSTATMANAFVR
jgi:hypothetical protein